MKIKNHILLFSIIIWGYYGCTIGNKQQIPQAIQIDCSDIKEFNLTEDNSTAFDLGFMDNITDVLFYEGLLLTRSRNQVSAFNVNTGELVYKCSNKGRREDEFTSIIDAWIRGQTLYVYDFNTAKVLRYDVISGAYIGNTLVDIPNRCSLLRWDAVYDRYVGVRTFSESPVPDLAVYDSSFVFNHYLDTPIKKSGITVSPTLKVSESSGILYHRPFERTVFKIKDDTLYEAFIVDFGENQIPDSFIEEKDIYDVILHWTDNQDKLAAFTMDFAESDNYFYFTYRFSDHVFFVSFNKEKNCSEVFRFDLGGDSPSAKIYYNDQHIYIFSQLEEGTKVYKVSADNL